MTRRFPRYPAPLRAAFLLFPLLLSGAASAWNAAGTVKNTEGTALSGVLVKVKDSSSYSATTDASGRFSIGSPTGIRLERKPSSSWMVQAHGRDLSIRCPLEGTVELALIDNTGRRLWASSSNVTDGAAQAMLPANLSTSAAWLVARQGGSTFSQALLVGADGARVASHLIAPRSLAAGNPVLLFSKSGYVDTSLTMASNIESNLAVVLRPEAASITCPSTKLSAGDQNKTITVKGVSRKYILHVPSTYKGDTPVPLLVDYHPIGGSASGQSSGTQYKAQADKDGAISVYPDGLQSPNMGQAWNVKGCCTTADDTAFARALVAEVKTLACIDPKRVYAAGFSMGGGMTHFTACHLADVFAAAAPAAFDLLKENVDICKPARPITMVMFRGTNDGVVNYAGGYSAVVSGMAINFLGAKATFAKWAELDKCTGSPSAEDANGCSTYSNCGGGVQVTLCTKQGGGHDQGNGSVGWPLLKKYTLP